MRTLAAFIIGTISGIMGGVLFAPKKGEEMRKETTDKMKRQLDEIEKTFEKKSTEAQKEYNRRLDEYTSKGHEILNQISNKVKMESK